MIVMVMMMDMDVVHIMLLLLHTRPISRMLLRKRRQCLSHSFLH